MFESRITHRKITTAEWQSFDIFKNKFTVTIFEHTYVLDNTTTDTLPNSHQTACYSALLVWFTFLDCVLRMFKRYVWSYTTMCWWIGVYITTYGFVVYTIISHNYFTKFGARAIPKRPARDSHHPTSLISSNILVWLWMKAVKRVKYQIG